MAGRRTVAAHTAAVVRIVVADHTAVVGRTVVMSVQAVESIATAVQDMTAVGEDLIAIRTCFAEAAKVADREIVDTAVEEKRKVLEVEVVP